MSSVQVPAYTTASTITPLSYDVVPTTATIIPGAAAVAPIPTTRKRNAKGNNNVVPASVATITPISAVPIVATDAGPIYEVELKKRLLDGQRELKEKQADMEADKEKKLEEKADKHRNKAVKWIGRGYPGLAAKHERNATKLDVQANEHYMVAESLRAQAKSIDRERKAFDPPKEEKKKPAAKSAAMRRPGTSVPPSSGAPSSGAPPAQRSSSTTTTQQPTPGAPIQRVERTTEQRPVQQQQPSLQKTDRPEEQQPSLRKEEVSPSRSEEPVVVQDAPADEVKTTERVEETPEGEKKVEKKEEKHHMLHHHSSEKNEQTAGGSSH